MLGLITSRDSRLNANIANHHLTPKCVSLASLIVSTWALLLTSVTFTALMPVVPTVLGTSASASAWDNSNTNNNPAATSGSFSNITLLDLYPELKDYLVKKALAQLASSPESSSFSDPPNALYAPQASYPSSSSSSWGDFSSSSANYNALSNYLAAYGSPGTNPASPVKHTIQRNDQDADTSDFYNYQKEVLKYLTPVSSPDVYGGWNFAPAASAPIPSYGWSSAWDSFPTWLNDDPEPVEVEHTVGHEVTKDFSCLAGLLGLKTLKKLKFAAILKKIKYIGIAILAFKLGLLLSPIAIPLLFPLIILGITIKIIPLILIIVLLLKILKKQVKLKKPFGKFLDQTSSLFFDDVDSVTEKVMRSSDCVDNISCKIEKSSSRRAKTRTNSRRLESKKSS